MKRRIILPLAVILVIATAAFAQQYGRGTGTPPSGPQSVIAGTVITFTASAGAGMPALAVDQNGTQLTLVLGPFWFLQNAKFAAAAGDRVELTVFACPDCPGGYAVVSVKNLTNGTSVTLRNADGLPMWQPNGVQGGPGNGPGGPGMGQGPGSGPGMGRGPGAGSGPGSGMPSGRGNGSSCNGTGADMTQVATFSGTVVSFAGGPGIGKPILVLNTEAGEKTFVVAPYRTVMNAGLTFAAGSSFTLTAAPNATQEWVVVTLKDNATGAELVLRDAQGLPVGGRRGGHC